MQSVDAQGNVITQGREGDKRNSLKGYPPLYSQDEQDSSLLILRSGDEGITLAPPTRKEQRKRERQARKGEKERRKTEARLLRGEAAMLAQLPTNMAVYAIPLIQGQVGKEQSKVNARKSRQEKNYCNSNKKIYI